MLENVTGPGRPAGSKNQARWQATYRDKLAKHGIKELRGLRASASEVAMLDWLVAELGYKNRCELLMMEMNKLARAQGYQLERQKKGA